MSEEFRTLALAPRTVGELIDVLADLPPEVRLIDEESEPPVFTLHFRTGECCEYVEVGR